MVCFGDTEERVFFQSLLCRTRLFSFECQHYSAFCLCFSFSFSSFHMDQAMRNTVMQEIDTMEPAESVASSAVKTAIDLDATMVIVLTETGNTARLLAKYRPDVPILAFTAAADAARQMNGYLRNVHSQVNERERCARRTDNRIQII